MSLRNFLIGALLLGPTLSAHAQNAATVLTRFKTASGGDAWDKATSWQGDGTLSTGGLSGKFHAAVDLRDGRSMDNYSLGSIGGADGYDGTHAWSRDPGGEIAALDAADAIRRARSQAWLDMHGYWYAQQHPATLANPQTREVDGKKFLVIQATPQDADPVTLWFATDSGLLVRTTQRNAQDTITTSFDDYRDVHGLRLPFHNSSDTADAAGRIDARQHSEVQLDNIALNVALTDADFAMPAMAVTARIDDPAGMTLVGFQLINNHIYVDAGIDGKPARLMVDTGGANILTPAAAKKFGLGSEGKLSAAGTGEEHVDLAMAHAHELRVGAAVLAQPIFYVLDLGALDSVEGVTCDGLVGYEMFRRFGVQIDYAKKQLTLTNADKFVAPVTASVVAFELDDRIPIVHGVLDGVPVKLSVDTGSRSSLSLHSPFVREHGLIARYHAAADSVLGWGVGGSTRGMPARLGTLTVGDLQIKSIAGDLFTGDKGSFANPDLSGNLGGGVLRRFTVTFDYANKRMYLQPNGDFGKADEFDRSGLWLLGDGDALKVTDVAPESAAQRAKLQTGDRITTIAAEPVLKRTVGEWRLRLRTLPVGTKLAIAFLRDGKASRAELQLADRIPSSAAGTP